jgi:DNA polymerase II large subunit
VPDSDDVIELRGRRAMPEPASSHSDPATNSRRFLSVWFRCCHTYGRMYRNTSNTRYDGRCPKCGATVQAVIGPGGTNRRMFVAE